MRGTFANIRLRNQLGGGRDPLPEGGVTRYLADGSGDEMSIYDAAIRYIEQHVPLIVLAAQEYGSGLVTGLGYEGDQAATGVRAVIAQSFERIHRSNLVGMGVLRSRSQTASSVRVARARAARRSVHDRRDRRSPIRCPFKPTVRADDNGFEVTVRIDTPKEQRYFSNGGDPPIRAARAAGPGRVSAGHSSDWLAFAPMPIPELLAPSS